MKTINFIVVLLISSVMLCAAQSKPKVKTDTVSSKTGLKYLILKKGTGAPSKAGQEVLIFETASYASGKVLFSNENTDRPIKVLIGGHQATDGEDEGLHGMQVGEVRKMFIPNYLCRRSSYPPNISPDSPIVVKVILHKILNNTK
ncbi:MAG: FKBP-type peptidyl-prolyl cis-trans isomerase [Bacteroidota bacterium]